MSDGLFPFLLLLTLLDLAFVQATGVVSGSGLLPLWVLAATSPWLRRLQRLRVCRVTWNVLVLLVFALLVHHASTTGLLYMLEDGLLLAVLCQVHLLNNVGERQRPDLVFFNSFLVAFVTSFFAPDLTWSLLFVTHAFVFVPALQVNVLCRRGGPVPGELVPVLLRDATMRTFVIGLVTALVFVALPRDFARQGWLGDAMGSPEHLRGGIGEQIRLDNEFPVRLGDDVVMRLTPASGDPTDVPTHWRAIAFSTFDGIAWAPQDAGRLGSRFGTDPTWEPSPDGSWRRAIAPDAAVVNVRLHDRDSRRLPMPLHAQELRLAQTGGTMLDPKSYGVLGVLRYDAMASSSMDYTVRMGASAGTVRPTPRVRHHMVSLPPHGVPVIVADLAERLRQRLPADASDEDVAGACSDWLQEHRRYELPGEPGFARNLGEFLIGSGAGHCEYFATALALLLRVQGIPCRLVGGYLAHEWDPESRSVVARSRHAHAWVEVMRADGAWLTFDPTPPADVMATRQEATSWWRATSDSLASLWSRVVGFDGASRAEWLRLLTDLPAAFAEAVARHPFWSGLALAFVLLLLYRRLRHRRNVPAIVDLERALRTAGLSLRDGETPRELLVRAAAVGLEPARLAVLQAAARRHESLRYGSCERGACR